MTHYYHKAFTLVEILIALSIFAIIGSITATVFYVTFSSREKINTYSNRLTEMQIARTLLQRDLEQIVNRPIRTEKGEYLPPFIGNIGYIEFTRAGFTNPMAILKRSNLQRVAYFLKDNKLIRRTWSQLDRIEQIAPDDRELLTNVNDLTFFYIDNRKNFHKNWTANTNLSAKNFQLIPLAIQIDMVLQNWGTMHLLLASHSGVTRATN